MGSTPAATIRAGSPGLSRRIAISGDAERASTRGAGSAATTGGSRNGAMSAAGVTTLGLVARRRERPWTRPMSGIGGLSPVAQVEHEVVHRHARGQQVREDADGVVLAPDEVARDHRAAGEADDPERAR